MSIQDFGSRPRRAISKEQDAIYRTYEDVDFNDKTFDDKKYNWKIVYVKGNDEKYGRYAVSEEYGLRRGLTMGEFYGNSEVD